MEPAGERTTAVRGDVLTFSGDPFSDGLDACMSLTSDAIVVMRDGRIVHVGPAADARDVVPEHVPIERYADAFIVAGFVDCHVHYPQTQTIGAHGEQLIDWLTKYAFPAEQMFDDPVHARGVADLFLLECLRNGTTSCATFCTVHPESVNAFFEASHARNMRNVAGKVLMDRNAPTALRDTPQRAHDESAALIARWHGAGRQLYAVTPRFAVTSTEAQLEVTRALWEGHPGTYLQSHVAENEREVAWVAELFADRAGYLDVYDHHGLLGPRAIYGHGIHLTEAELQRCHDTGTAIAHCPTSNLFLGSGMLDVRNTTRPDRPVRTGLATDLGGGTSFSMLQTMRAAYEVAQSCGYPMSAGHAFYLATRGSAAALRLEDTIGSIAVGMEADLVVLDRHATPLLEHRMGFCDDFAEALFVLMTLGDDRATRATYVDGALVYDRDGG